MTQMQPAIALLESEAEGLRARISALDAEAGELRARLSGLEAATTVLRGSAGSLRAPAGSLPTGPVPMLPAPAAEPPAAEPPAARSWDPDLVERVLAAIAALGPRASVASMASAAQGVVPEGEMPALLAHLEGEGRIRVVALGPMKGAIERISAERLDPPPGPAARPDAGPAASPAHAPDPAPASVDVHERLLAAIAELGPAARNPALAEAVGLKCGTIKRHLRDLEATGRIRRTGSTHSRQIELVEAPPAPEAGAGCAEAEGRVRFSTLDRATEDEHAGAFEPAPAEDATPAEAPAAEPAPPAEIPPPVAVVEPTPAPKPKPAPRRRVVDPTPEARSAGSRPVAPRPPSPPAAKFRKPASETEAEVIARHLAVKGASRYEPGTFVGLLERAFTGAGMTFRYNAGIKAARAPYVINDRPLTPAKAIERANEIRRKAGLEPLAVPGGKAKR